MTILFLVYLFDLVRETGKWSCSTDTETTTGRGRNKASSNPEKGRCRSVTAFRVGGHDIQGLVAVVHDQQDAKVFPNKREQELQHGAEHGEENLQFQLDRGGYDGRHGCGTSSGGQILFPGCSEG